MYLSFARLAAIAAFALVISNVAIADDLTLPNTFTAGTPARAAEVNGNFAAVELSVDDNAADIALNTNAIALNAAVAQINTDAVADNQADIQSNSSSIAALAAGGGITAFSQGIAIGRIATLGNRVEMISDMGYWFSAPLEIPGGGDFLADASAFYYSATNCTGQAYVSAISSDNIHLLSYGMVFAAPGRDVNGFSAYYVPKNAGGYIQINYASRRIGGTCTNQSLTEYGWAAFPNDPAITGVSNVVPTLPLSFGLP